MAGVRVSGNNPGVRNKAVVIIAQTELNMMRLPVIGEAVGKALFDGSLLARKGLPPIMKEALSFSGGVVPEKIDVPEMIDIPGMRGKRIMRSMVTVGLFKQVMDENVRSFKQGMKEYEIKGQGASGLRALLADPAKEKEPLTCVSVLDGREFAKRLSYLTGRKFRLQTEDEWFAAKDGLQGNEETWTDTQWDSISFVTCPQCIRRRNHNYPFYDERYTDLGIRLVEDV